MADTKKIQEEAGAIIDTSKALIDKVLCFMELGLLSPSIGFTSYTNPIGFLMWLLKKLGVSYEEIRLWLTNFLIYVIPTLEISVKTILLTNLKSMASCSIDPRIPEKYRKRHKIPEDYNTSQEYGIDINVESIDFLDKLSIDPLSDIGKEMYFGLDGIEDVYKFARADDFDAFLWFVIHKGQFPKSAVIKNMSDFTTDIHVKPISVSGDSLLDTVTLKYDPTNGSSSILVGNTFTYSGSSHVISMCIDRKYNEKNEIVENTLVPVSDDWSSVNWYARKADQLGKNIGFGWGVNQNTSDTKYKGKTRDFSDENAICNIQFIDQASSDSPITGLVNNKFRFTILPRPLIIGLKKMLFNSKGIYDPNGKFTIDNEEQIKSDGTVDPKNLHECYKGLTVYEFNYDYIMSLKLFDAKVIATALLDSLQNLNVGVNITTAMPQGNERIKEVIKNIVNADEEQEINDCFYSFDNAKYEALLNETEKLRAAKGKPSVTNDLNHILDEYNENATYEEQISVINRAFDKASAVITEGVNDVDANGIKVNFVYDLIEQLTMAIMSSILSPKVLMLLEVNQQMMGGTWEKFTSEDIIKSMQSIIVSIVKDIRDLIIIELLKLVEKNLMPIINLITNILVREKIENYVDVIRDLMQNCPYIWFSFGNNDQDTQLDTVDYADIFERLKNENEQPITNNC